MNFTELRENIIIIIIIIIIYLFIYLASPVKFLAEIAQHGFYFIYFFILHGFYFIRLTSSVLAPLKSPASLSLKLGIYEVSSDKDDESHVLLRHSL